MNCQTLPNPIDPIAFRNALGAFATGVTVVTTHCAAVGKVGLTANSFNSVSLDPPMVLWSLAKTSRALDFFLEAGCFCVNILAADQVSLSNHFASKAPDKFASVDFEQGRLGIPVLSGCAATFECKTAFTYEGGDHTIFVGEVVDFVNAEREALLYHGGRYAVSQPHPVIASNRGTSPPEPTGFVDGYLDYLLAKSTHLFEAGFQPHLDRRGISKSQWRVLVTITDYQSLDLHRLANIVLIEPEPLQQLLERMAESGFLRGDDTGYQLLAKGKTEVTHLLAAAKAHEADVLGQFSLDESRQLKALLARMV